MTDTSNISYEERKAARLRNYIEYYENQEKRGEDGIMEPLTLEQLNELSIMELLDLMPQNKSVPGEYSEKLGITINKALVSFKICKVIDGTWNLEYSEGHRDKPLKDQYFLFDFRCRDLKLGLIDMYLRVQQFTNDWWNGVKSGRIVLSLDDTWEDRTELGLDK